MMWKARVNAICARAHGTGSTAATSTALLSKACTSILPGVGPAGRWLTLARAGLAAIPRIG